MNTDFSTWLDKEIHAKGWNQSEVARRGEISSQMVNAVVNGQANPGLEFCKGIARAFQMPPEDVLRLAGLLPALTKQPRPVRDNRRVVYEINGDEVLLTQYRALSAADQALVRDLIMRLGQVEPRIIGEAEE